MSKILNKKVFLILTIACSNILLGQNNTNSPYSIFGLGIENKTSTGNLSALGNTGIANDSRTQINITNPASLGNINKKSFLYEFGVNAVKSTFKDESTSESQNTGNISHVAIAFPIKNNWGIGLGVLPETKVGYNLTTESSIEGSIDSFSSNFIGEGGINNFYIATGIKFGKKVSVGLEASFLFGTINELNTITSTSVFTINDENHYTGLNLKTGFQYAFLNKQKTVIGGTLEIPANLNGTQTRNTTRVNALGITDNTQIDEKTDLNDFNLPIISGIGITSEIYKDFTASLDFTKLLWEDTDQADNDDQFVNQEIYAFGLEYAPSKKKLKYFNRLKYRFGFNYNTGFLHISDEQINSYFLSLGVGIPLNQNRGDLINLSYSYGKQGEINDDLIQENFHKITLNLSLVGKWFKERKIF